jgi:asparagine N-glycosylation enzyme membrane subunit Stt3
MIKKESLKKIGNQLKEKKGILQYLLLAIAIIMGISIRISGIAKLKSSMLGQYLPQALDPYFFLRIATLITQPGSLPATDILRSYPLGQQLGFFENLMSYFLVWFNKILNIFGSYTLDYTTILFPVILMALSTILLFLLVKRLLGWKTAILSALILNIIPAFLHRTNVGFSDHDILGIFFLLLTIYLFVIGLQSKKLHWNIIFSILAGLAYIVGRYAAGNVAIALLVIGGAFGIKTLFNKISKSEIYCYSVWAISMILFSLIIGGFSSLKNQVTGIVGFIIYSILIILITKLIIEKPKIKNYLKRIKIPDNVKYISIGVIIMLIILFIFLGPSGFIENIQNFINNIIKTFSTTRHATTVAENQPLTFTALKSNFSTIFTILSAVGTAWIFSKTIKEHKHKKTLVYSFITFIILFFISKVVDSASLFIIGLIAILAYLIYYFIKNKSKEKIEINNYNLLILMWIIALTYAVNSAARLIFEFSIIMCIASAFAIVTITSWIIQEEKILKEVKSKTKIWIKVIAIIIFAFILLSPFGFYKGTLTEFYENTDNQAEYIGPGLNQQWQMAAKWGKQNLPEEAIFAHWWDYGYWVQYGFERPTITDGGNQINFWNYLIGRDVLTAPDFETPLKFLKAHNATNLLIISDEIGKYGAYSLIGSDENMDRFSQIQTFVLDQSLTEEKRNQTIFTYRGGIPLDEDFIYEGLIYPKSKAGILGVRIPIQINNGNIENIDQPTVILVNGNQRKELTLECLYMNNQEIIYPEYQFPGCFRLVPVWLNQQQNNQMGAGIFLSERTYNTLFSKLFLLNQQNEYYKEVYNDKNNFPLSIYQGRLMGPLKIWEIQYPENFKLTEEEMKYNLATSFEEVGLESRK